MKKTKKILSVFLAVSILLSLAIPTFAASSAGYCEILEYEGMDFSCAEESYAGFGSEYLWSTANGKAYCFCLLDSGEYALVDLATGEIVLKEFTYQGRNYCPNGAIEIGGKTYFEVNEGDAPSRHFVYDRAGFVDEAGNIMLGCEEGVVSIYMYSDDLFLVNTSDNGGYLYNAKTNTKTYKTNQADVHGQESFEEYGGTYIKLASDGKYHFVDVNGNISNVGISIDENYNVGAPRSGGLWSIWWGRPNDMDGQFKGWIKNNNVFYAYGDYSQVNHRGYGIFKVGGKLVDIDGNVILTDCDSTFSLVEGFIIVSVGGKDGLINHDGDLVLPVEYDYIDYNVITDDDVNCFVATKNGKTGLVDENGNAILPFEYDSIREIEGFDGYAVSKNGKEGLVDKDGNTVVPFEYDYIAHVAENEVVVENHKDEYGYDCTCGVVDKNNNVLIPLTDDYDYIGVISGGYIVQKGGYWTDSEEYGMIDKQNNVIIPFGEYDYISRTDDPEILNATKRVDGESIGYYLNINGEIVFDLGGMSFDDGFSVGIDGVLNVSAKDGKWYRVVKKGIEEGTITGVTLSDAEYTYDGTEKSLAVSGTLPEGAVVTYEGEKATNAGTYNVSATVTADGYKPLVLRATMKINPAPITVTADSHNIILGEALPELTYKVTSGALAEGDSFRGNLSTNARITREGTYDVLQGTLKLNSNYKLTFVKGTITISTKTPQNITVSEITAKTYGDDSFVVTATADEVSGLSSFTYESSNISVATVAADGTVTIVGAGEADITVKEAGNDEYAPFEKTQTLVVSQKEVSVEAIDLSEKTATIAGVLEADNGNVELDFSKLLLELGDAVEGEEKFAVSVTNLVLKGEKGANYKITTEEIETTVPAESVATVSTVAENGTVSGEGSYLVGSEVTLSAKAASGYKFNGWYENEKLVSSAAEYTFVIEADIELEARFKKNGGHGGFTAVTVGGGSSKPTEPEKPVEPEVPAEPEVPTEPETPEEPEVPAASANFTDLGNYAWAEDAVATLVEKGIIKGTSETTYSPAANIIRADFVALVVRMFDLESENEENFADVNPSDYFARELAIARNNGIVGGIGDNKFAPRGNITRQDMMVMLYRAMDKLGIEFEEAGDVSASDFDEVSDYAKEAVSTLVANGIIKGRDGKIDPMATATRAEVAVMLSRVLDLKK